MAVEWEEAMINPQAAMEDQTITPREGRAAAWEEGTSNPQADMEAPMIILQEVAWEEAMINPPVDMEGPATIPQARAVVWEAACPVDSLVDNQVDNLGDRDSSRRACRPRRGLPRRRGGKADVFTVLDSRTL